MEYPLNKSVTPGKVVAVFIGSLVILLGYACFTYGDWTVFIANVWFAIARHFIWLGVAVGMLGLCALAARKRDDPDRPFAKVWFVVAAAGLLFGWMSQALVTGAAAFMNGVGGDYTVACFEMVDAGRVAYWRPSHARNVTVFAPDSDKAVPRNLRSRSYNLDLSKLESGDKFELRVREGLFGYSAELGQTPVPGCRGGGADLP